MRKTYIYSINEFPSDVRYAIQLIIDSTFIRDDNLTASDITIWPLHFDWEDTFPYVELYETVQEYLFLHLADFYKLEYIIIELT